MRFGDQISIYFVATTMVHEMIAQIILKKYDYAFIGDSQTEGVGLNFEDTFVGNFAKQNKLDVINLGIIRSSPSLLKRLKFF